MGLFLTCSGPENRPTWPKYGKVLRAVACIFVMLYLIPYSRLFRHFDAYPNKNPWPWDAFKCGTDAPRAETSSKLALFAPFLIDFENEYFFRINISPF